MQTAIIYTRVSTDEQAEKGYSLRDQQRVKSYKDEPEEIVQGIYEPIISEALFHEVQNELDGKKKAKTKYSLVNNDYPMRRHLICPRCGKTLTGSSALGNGANTIIIIALPVAGKGIKAMCLTMLLKFG